MSERDDEVFDELDEFDELAARLFAWFVVLVAEPVRFELAFALAVPLETCFWDAEDEDTCLLVMFESVL